MYIEWMLAGTKTKNDHVYHMRTEAKLLHSSIKSRWSAKKRRIASWWRRINPKRQGKSCRKRPSQPGVPGKSPQHKTPHISVQRADEIQRTCTVKYRSLSLLSFHLQNSFSPFTPELILIQTNSVLLLGTTCPIWEHSKLGLIAPEATGGMCTTTAMDQEDV